MRSCQSDPGLADHHVVQHIHGAYPVHALQTQQHLALGNLAPNKPCIAALRGDRRTRLVTDADDGGYLLSTARQRQEGGLPAPAIAPFHQLRGQPLRVSAPATFAEHGFEA